jgi:hypothetical protein
MSKLATPKFVTAKEMSSEHPVAFVLHSKIASAMLELALTTLSAVPAISMRHGVVILVADALTITVKNKRKEFIEFGML